MLAVVIAMPSAFAAPKELPAADVIRTPQNAAKIVTQLSENLYRTETYEDNYTVQVPYQEEEVYYEDVPYQEWETYTEWEEYWDWERLCKDHTEWERRCENKRVCEPKFERRCEIKKICSVHVPGVIANALFLLYQASPSFAEPGGGSGDNGKWRRDRGGNGGGGSGGGGNNRGGNNENEEREKRNREERENRDRENRERENRDRENRERERREREERDRRDREDRDRRDREDRDRRDREDRERREEERRRRCHKEVCENVKVGETCTDKQICKDIPRKERRCKDEHVRKTRPVSKQRLVTKYRSERRTRWVTRYRNETRCCVTKERQVFDRQVVANVEMKFSELATLETAEKETFRLKLINARTSPDIEVEGVSTIYSYQPEVTKVSDEQFVVEMNLIPTYKAADLGAQTLSGFKLMVVGKQLRLSFEDKGVVKKADTSYQLHLLDPVTKAELFKATRDQETSNVRWDLNWTAAVGAQVLVVLNVERNGIVIDGPVTFTSEQSLTVEQEAPYNAAPYMDKNLVGKFSLSGQGANLVINFRDLTEAIPQVRTEYAYKVLLQTKTGPKLLAEKVFQRTDLKVAPDGKIPLSAAADFGISEADLVTLSSGKVITVEGEVRRFGSRFKGESFVIPKKVNLTIP